MDLTRLPVSLNKMKKSDMETIRQDREVWWNKFYAKYEKLSEDSEDDVGIEEIADPRRLEREDDIRMENNKLRLEPIVSKTFQNWIREHGEEIDELTTIAGPPGSDEEEIMSDEDIHEDEMEESDSEDLMDDHCESENRSWHTRSLVFDSDDDSELGPAIPSSFSKMFLSPAKSLHNSSFRDKFLSPIVTSSRNISLMESSINNSSLVCSVCSVETDYSRDMGVEETSFKCDNCLLSVHQDCEKECNVCRSIASKVDTRRKLKIYTEEKQQSDSA